MYSNLIGESCDGYSQVLIEALPQNPFSFFSHESLITHVLAPAGEGRYGRIMAGTSCADLFIQGESMQCPRFGGFVLVLVNLLDKSS